MLSKLKWLILFVTILLASSCSSVGYYMQAISGHIDVVSREKPIKEIIEQQDTDQELKRRLQLSLKAREFASTHLSLPDNDSYKNYADLERQYVVWTVVATPRYSIKPEQWCFYFVGCLSYRGYFSKEDAEALAEELKQQGMDVHVGGTLAYSTLGYFDDPLVSSMLSYDDANLIGVIFHELAHQVVHIDGDTSFNEAFASAVETEGLRRWFEVNGTAEQYEQYLLKKKRQHEFFSQLKELRNQLDLTFQQTIAEQEKEKQKKALYIEFKEHYANWAEQNKYHAYDKWVNRDINNSHLAMIATYYDLVPTFTQMLHSVNGDFKLFFDLVTEVGEKEKPEREKLLLAYIQNEGV